MRLLLVDDDPSCGSSCRPTFDGVRPWSVEEADERRRGGRRRSQRRLPDVVVLDIAHARHDGLELCRRLKADAADERRSPVVLLTGSDAPAAAASSAGADAYLRKPFRPLELLGVDRAASPASATACR